MSDRYSAAATAPLTTMASAMFFGTILFATVALAIKTILSGDGRSILASATNGRSSPLDIRSPMSIYTLLHHFSILGLILGYAYLCEYHPPFPHADKTYDRDEFFFLTALLLLVSGFTLQANDRSAASSAPTRSDSTAIAPVNDKTEVLNRDQTEEWKGWMQFMFLLYHYFHAEEVYNSIRVMITCYVWMTGFGNFSFFYIKGDYGAVRVLQMLWRLNFLVVFLCLTQGTTYILYYICLLHTYYFLMVYVIMRVAKDVNYTHMGLRYKLAAAAVLIYVVWDLRSGIFYLVHRPFLGERPMLGATSGALWEWYFRSSLDHWSTFLGMVFALNFPITSLFMRKLEAQPVVKHVLAKFLMALAMGGVFVWWVLYPFHHDKFAYNQTNAYFAPIPVFVYIYFRNITPWLRSHSLDLLHQIGKTTLETYLMQHHIWLTSDAKSLLTLIPGWPKMNFLLVTCLYFVLSRKLYQLTLFLRGMVLPNDRNECLRNLLGLMGSILVFLALATVLRLIGQLNLFTVVTVSMSCGMGLVHVIVSRTGAPGEADCSSGMFSTKTKAFVAPLGGALVITGLCLSWHHMASIGASKILPLPGTCEAYVHHGGWIPIDACAQEDIHGMAYREDHVAALGTCAPQSNTYTWGWLAAPSNSHCRFAHRDPTNLLKMLNHRRVVFVGDSVIRHLYFSTCRQLGDAGAGAYNTTLGKWQDFTRTYRNTVLEFKWAPYTDTVVDAVRNITKETTHPDLVVVGGGPWDRLHRYHNESEQTKLHSLVGTMTQELHSLEKNAPVAWVIPTTINDWGLLTDEKRANIKESDISALREVYRSKGVYDSVSFVLDGVAFTIDRVPESYDGVHYPLSVYDAGAQILANAMDWLIREPPIEDPFTPPKPGKMAHPLLGLLVIAVVFVGIFLMDGFLGVSYLAALIVPSCRPTSLYEDAFAALHARVGLPPIEPSGLSVSTRSSVPSEVDGHVQLSGKSEKSKSSDHHFDQEFESLLDDLDHDHSESNGDDERSR